MTVVQKRALIVIAPRDFRDEELSEPVKYLEKFDILFDIISTTRGLAVGMLGGKVLIEKTIGSVLADGIDKYDALLIIGGRGSPEYLWGEEKLHTITREFHAKGKLIGAICLSPVVLAKAGIIQGKAVTVWNDDTAINEITKAGGIYKPQPLVVDEKIITANGPTASAAFGEKIAKALAG